MICTKSNAQYWLLLLCITVCISATMHADNQQINNSNKGENNFGDQGPESPIPGLMQIFIGQLGSQMQEIQELVNVNTDEQENQTAVSEPVKKTFADVRGHDSVLVEVREIVDFLKNPKKYKNFDAQIPKGVLLHGAPGTGKTLIAQAIAGEANCKFFYISASEFVDRFVGMGARNVREFFNKARKAQPAILFIDEVDAIGGISRGSPNGSEEYRQTLNELLNQLDGFKKDENIVVIAATNIISGIDPALLRPGRFTRVIEVPLPTRNGRIDILNYYLGCIDKQKIASDVFVERIADQTIGFSGADLSNLVNEAKLLAIRQDAQMIAAKHFEEAWDKIVIGLPGDHSRSKDQQLKTAYHEAGHALIKYCFGMPIAKVTIMPRGNTLGVTMSIPKYELSSDYSRKEWLEQIMVCQGGFIAEKIVYGQAAPGVCSDLARANEISRTMVNEWGMGTVMDGIAGNGFDSESMRALCDNEVRGILQNCLYETEALLSKQRDKLDILAQALMDKETLSGEDISCLLGHKSIA